MEKEKQYRRVFSEQLKRKLVLEIEKCELSVTEVSRIYKVSSVSVYRWLSKYSSIYQKKSLLVVEEKSEGKKRKLLEEQVKELQRSLGEKQMRLDYLEKLLELHKAATGEDIEKKGV